MELLTVMAIITLLIAIILPSLGYARENARRTQCLSNLHQMLVASVEYASANGDSYPSAYWLAAPAAAPYSNTTRSWDFFVTSGWDDDGNPLPALVQPGFLWQGSGNNAVQQCPSFDGSSNSPGDPYTGYNYNTTYIGRGSGESPSKSAIRITDVHHPATTAIFGDGQYGGGANKYMRAPFSYPDAWFLYPSSGTQGFRHHGATNVGFCDGHAESLTLRYTNTTAQQQANIAPGTGFLSADNSMYDPR